MNDPVPNGEEQEISIPWFRWKLLGDQAACRAFKAIPQVNTAWNQEAVKNEQPCESPRLDRTGAIDGRRERHHQRVARAPQQVERPHPGSNPLDPPGTCAMPAVMPSASPLLHDDVLRRLARAREAMSDEFGEALRLDVLARAAGLSEKHFRRLFQRAYGTTPGRFLAGVRIARAKELLARGTSVTEACMRVGFSSLGSFSAKFASTTGRSPRQFQRELRAIGGVPERLVSLYVPLCFLAHVPAVFLGPDNVFIGPDNVFIGPDNVRFQEVGRRGQR